jgi:hypothetical protein
MTEQLEGTGVEFVTHLSGQVERAGRRSEVPATPR